MPRIKARKQFTSILSSKSIDDLIRELKEYKDDINYATHQFTEKMLELGLSVARTELLQARGGDFDKPVGEFDLYTNGWGEITNGTLKLSGEQVLFFEFGAGIYFNNGKTHPLAGQFGYGVGSYPNQKHAYEKGWSYPDANNDKKWHYTHGTEAAMPMYLASKEMKEQIYKIAREVFQNVIK